MREAKQTFVVENVKAKPDFCSFARGWSFFGTFANTNADHATLAMQAMTDTDIVGMCYLRRHRRRLWSELIGIESSGERC